MCAPAMARANESCTPVMSSMLLFYPVPFLSLPFPRFLHHKTTSLTSPLLSTALITATFILNTLIPVPPGCVGTLHSPLSLCDPALLHPNGTLCWPQILHHCRNFFWAFLFLTAAPQGNTGMRHSPSQPLVTKVGVLENQFVKKRVGFYQVGKLGLVKQLQITEIQQQCLGLLASASLVIVPIQASELLHESVHVTRRCA